MLLVGRTSHLGSKSAAYELRREEASRARAFAGSAFVLAGVVLAEEALFDDSAIASVLSLASFVALAFASAHAYRAAREPLRYTRSVALALAGASLVSGTCLSYRLGVFSPAPMVTTLGVAFFGLGESKKIAYGFTFGAGLAYALVAWLVANDTIQDPGVVQAAQVAPGARYAFIFLVPIIHAATLWHARLSRRASLSAIDRSHEWFREARQREVQLDEANRDLDNLLKVNASDAAAYSGARAGADVILDRIGRGAMGEVYSARHAETGDAAAVKLIHPTVAEDSMVMQRFLREGDAASKLNVPNVVKIFEVGNLEDGAPYLAMELLRGHDLAWHLRRRGALSLEEVLSLVEQVSAGLEAARAAGVVHRDLKPQNLFLAQQTNAAPVWKILDFGVSRLADSGGTLTKDVIVGTPGYMSPEQAGGLNTTGRSDIFSLGAVIYRTLTGEPPFTGADTPQTLYQVVYKNPPRPSELVEGLPPDIDLVLAIALAKDPADRYETALDFAGAFRLAAKGALDPTRRLHARTLLAALPWGTPSRDSSEDIDELSLSDADAIDG
jgi:serine/threonine-protein kinase